jgi:histidine kinase
MELTLKRGISPLSPFAFAIYGVSQISLGNTECGYRFGKVALSLLGKMENQEAACPTFGFTLAVLSCWKEPIRDLVDPLFQSRFSGFARGDTLFGSYCTMAQSFAMQTIRGENLETLEIAMRDTYNSMVSKMGQSVLCLWYQSYLQYTILTREVIRGLSKTWVFYQEKLCKKRNSFDKLKRR